MYLQTYEGVGQAPQTSSTASGSIGSLFQQIQGALAAGQWYLALTLAVLSGDRDVNRLTNMIFFARHPERGGRKLDASEPNFKGLSREWLDIRSRLVRPAIQKLSMDRIPVTPPTPVAVSQDARLFKYHPPTTKRRYGGYSRYGGGRVDKRLKELQVSGRLPLSDADIDMLQRIANVESSGQIQGINSYDSAFMSMGFMQWPIAFGKLQRLIQRAPEAFRRYGIELDPLRKYRIRTRYGIETPMAIKGAQNPSDLRSLEWAQRFYIAGLDPDIIIEEVKLALEVIEESKRRIVKRVGSDFLLHYERSAVLRALIQETFNNRPAYLYIALKRSIERARKMADRVSTNQFLELVREAIREVYQEKEPEDGPKKADNLIRKTASLIL